ncbi:MAG TPA: hydrogenase maturation protease [Acidobacteriaceae bacterium]
MSTNPKLSQVAVIGLGNVFLGDDGFGPLAIEMFRCEYECEASVEVSDLGTPGLDLAPYLYDRELVVIVDAVQAGLEPGTLSVFREDDFVSSRAKLRITGHDPGLWEALAHLRMAGHAPSELVVIGMTPASCRFGEGINASVMASALEAATAIARLLTQRGVACQQRTSAVQPDLWWQPLLRADPCGENNAE